jgi:UDP-GlcNAc3NAcA epimerase
VSTIVTILGARPQFIKASVVSKALARLRGEAFETVVHTGQHYDAGMSDVFFAELDMRPPKHHLGIHGGSHGAMTGRMLEGIEKILMEEKPAAVVIYGDTNSTLAGALAAAKLHIPIAHVEAGLRSFNMRMPEEINRIVADRLSRWLFTPTEAADVNLRREGVAEEAIIRTGDVMFDVAREHGQRPPGPDSVLARLRLQGAPYVLVTVHRAENTDDPVRLNVIVEALMRLADRLPIVWPLHPRTRAVLARTGDLERLAARVHLIEPVGYFEMVQLEKNAATIATDSGGVQKEAFFHGVPCVTLRDETEWIELVDGGWNRLAPPVSVDAVMAAVGAAIGSRGADIRPFGGGDAAQTLAGVLSRAVP